MKKYYMTKTCKLLSKSENIKAIDNRNKEILGTYDFTKVLNKIQSSIDKVQILSESGTCNCQCGYYILYMKKMEYPVNYTKILTNNYFIYCMMNSIMMLK